MIKPYRAAFNKHFTEEKYQAILDDIAEEYGYRPSFRIAETPVFIPKLLKERLQEACVEINDILMQPDFKELTKDAIKHPMLEVPGEDYNSRFIQMDFGICVDENGDPTPQLIELQGFPSLYFFQDLLTRKFIKHYDIPNRFSTHLNGVKQDTYIEILRGEIVGDTEPKHVVLLEIEPEKQATYIDFLGAEKNLGIKVLCITKIKKQGKQLFYEDTEGNLIQIKKIYNRVIFDELDQRDDIQSEFHFGDEVEVEWVGHPNWFFRISKYTMPLFKSKYVPECFYLNELDEYPADLENYVLKPLYSFAGAGVNLHITKADLDAIEQKDNYILQRKVDYVPIIETLDVPAKCEVRMMCLWNKDKGTAQVVNNLVRLSKGEMIGVRYNKDKEWVGGTVGFFEDEVY